MKFSTLLCAVGLGAAAAPVAAYDLPALNLGGTSFYDGAPAPSGPGWYAIEYFTFVQASRLNDGQSQRLPLPQQRIDLFLPITQLVYAAPGKWYGMQPGVTALLPVLARAKVEDGLGHAVLRGGTGVGDLTLGAFLQFDPVVGEKGPTFSHRLELDVIAPTGRYDAGHAVNPGSNFWSLNPHWAFTAWATPQFSFSGRLHYLWNGRNRDPATGFGPGVASTRAGQAAHANLTAEYAVRPGLSVGLNGYWLRQTTDTQANGVDLPGRKERVWAVGPGMLYAFSRETSMFVNLYSEQGARNRAEGTRLVVRINHHF